MSKQKKPSNAICDWMLEISGDYYETRCGNAHQFTEGGPRENHYAYCPYCGSRLRATPEGDRS